MKSASRSPFEAMISVTSEGTPVVAQGQEMSEIAWPGRDLGSHRAQASATAT